MINFDSLTLKLFCEENKQFFVGAKIQKVQQPNRHELIFQMRSNGQSKKFYINFNPNFYHLCFMSADTEAKRQILIPKAAPMFCMLLRKYIQNSKIVNVEVPKNERIFEIYFEYFDELNEKTILCFAIELMGKHSNVILYNYDTNVIIGCAHNVSAEKSRERELSGLLPYTYPPKKKKKDILKADEQTFWENLDNDNLTETVAKKYHYLTIPMVDYILSVSSRETLFTNLQNYLADKNIVPSIKNDYSQYFIHSVKESFECSSINEMVDEYFTFHQMKFLTENLRKKLSHNISAQLKKLKTLKEKQIEQVNKIEKANLYKLKADVLMANLYQIQTGAKRVDLYDFEGNAISIDLDENLSATDNANRYYALYKKAKAANEHAQELLKETLSQILYYEELNFYTEISKNITELEDIQNELQPPKEAPKEKDLKVDFVEYKGFTIFIGKNKKQNDYILSKIASSEDLWFHPLNAAGAHVLIKINSSKTNVDDEVLLKAAELTKEFSSQQNNSKTSIIYTKRKYVKKANNKQAFVTYKNESEIVV